MVREYVRTSAHGAMFANICQLKDWLVSKVSVSFSKGGGDLVTRHAPLLEHLPRSFVGKAAEEDLWKGLRVEMHFE